MYQDLRPKPEPVVNIIIEVADYEVTCGGCPTIIDFKDKEGTNYYFRLRHGTARLVCEESVEEETLVHETMDGFDGVCSFDDVIKWAAKYGVQINY